MVAKQTVSTGSSTGQTVTLNMNTTRLRAYRKLRRKGMPHPQALAMAKRVRMAKAAPWDSAKHPRAPAGQTTGGQFSAGKGSAAAANPARGGPGAAVARELAVLRGRLAAVNVRIRATKAQIAKLQGQLSPQQRSQSRSQAARKAAQTRKAHGAKRGVKRATRHAAPLSPAQRKLIALQRQLAALNAQATRIKAEIAKVSASGIAKAAPYTALHPPIIHHGRINWVDRVGGLPGPIDAIARVLIAKGWDEQRAVATAVSTAKKSCATGRAFGGKVALHPTSQAVICAAVADWEAKKAAA